MAHSAKIKAPSDIVKKGFSVKNFFSFLQQWAFRNKIYFLAFIIPVIIMFIAYAMFKIYPFGDESVLVLDLNGQYVHYFEALRDAFWGDGSALYSWSRNLSGGYMGIIGYYLASPFTLVVLLLPRTMLLGSLLIMILLKIGAAGVTFSYYLQKSKGMKPFQSVIFSSLYALMAYGVIQLMNPMWLDGLILLPLIMLGVEYLIDDGRKLNYIIPLALMFIANFYIGFMIAIFTFLYFMFYLLFGSDKTLKISIYDKWSRFVRFMGATVVVLLCSAFMLLPVYNALKLGKFEFSDPNYTYSAQFSPIDFFMQMFAGQYDSVNPEKSPLPEIYCGVLSVVMLPLFYLNKKIPNVKKAGYTVFLFIMFICMYVKPIDMMWHGGQEPNWLPFRYSFTFSFLILCMAATAFTKLDGIKIPAICGSGIGIIIFLLINESRGIKHITSKEIWISVGLTVIYAGMLLVVSRYKKAMNFIAPLVIFAVSSGELLYNSYDTLKSEDAELSYSTHTSWYDYINNGRAVTSTMENMDKGFYRAEKTFHRTVNDNLALGLKGISHSSSVMNARLLKFLEAMGYNANTYYSRYDGNTPVSDSLLGIKYVLDKREPSDELNKKGLVNSIYDYKYSCDFNGFDPEANADKEQVVDVYENTGALAMGYMADTSIQNIAAFGNDNPFNSQNLFLSTVAGDTVIDLNDTSNPFKQYTEYFKPMNVNPDDFVLSNVTTEPYGNDQIKYVAEESGDPTVDMFITPDKDGDVYMYFKTEFQHAVNLWLSTEQDENGQYVDFEYIKTYFENHDYHIINLGNFKAGQTFNLRMTVANEFTIVKNFFFYQLDEDAYTAAVTKLKEQQWNLTKAEGRRFEGTIEARENQIMMTSIPYEPGWSIKVDGKRVDNLVEEIEQPDGSVALRNTAGETGQVIIADAMIGVRLLPGTHTVEMTYTPPGLNLGIFTLLAGIVIIVFIYKYDKKNNKVLIALRRQKRERALQPVKKPESDNVIEASAEVKGALNEAVNNANTQANTASNSKKQKKKGKKKKR